MPKDPESPVKNWQLDAVEKQQGLQEKFLARTDDRLEKILSIVQTLPTTQQLEDRIATLRLEFQTQIKVATDTQDLKYQPIVNSNRWFLRLLAASTLGLVGSVLLLLIQVFTK